MLNAITKSWKTTVMGIFAFFALINPEVQALLDSDPLTVVNWGNVVAAFSMLFGLLFARDNDITSEVSGAIQPNPGFEGEKLDPRPNRDK